jgi:hypothetical protein
MFEDSPFRFEDSIFKSLGFICGRVVLDAAIGGFNLGVLLKTNPLNHTT